MTAGIQDMAIRYFNGTVTRREEEELERFINSDAESRALFKRWEEEWAGNHVMGREAERSYKAFVRRIEADSPGRVSFKRMWRRIAVSVVVSILSVGGVFTAWYFSKHGPEKYYTCTVPYGSKSCLELPDGSVVWLNAGSKLRYSDRFNEDSRRVELEGEGYFDVKKNAGKIFVVKTNDCDIIVKGTRFDVSAYRDDDMTSVSLMQGGVQVNSKQEEMTIRPGEKVTINRRSGKITKSVYEAGANTWIDNNLDFESVTLGELTKILSRQFNVRFIIRSGRLANVRFSVLLKQKETITDVMAALQAIQPMTVVKKGRDIYLEEQDARKTAR